MNSIDLAEEICDEIKKFRKWVQAEGDLIARKKESGDESYIPEEMYFDSKYTGDSIHIEQLLVDLYKNSVKDNFFFYDCPLQVYKHHYQSRLNDYLQEYIDANELDFIQDELTDLEKTFENRWLFNEINYYSFTRDNKFFKQTLEKKKVYLQAKRTRIKNSIKFNDKNTEIDKNTESTLLVEEIVLKIKAYQELEELLLKLKKTSLFYEKEKLLEAKKVLEKKGKVYEKAEKEIKILIKELYYSSAKDNFYWLDCPSAVYLDRFADRFNQYQVKHLDGTKLDFIKNEIGTLVNINTYRFFIYNEEKINYQQFISDNEIIFRQSINKKIEFLEYKLKEENTVLKNFNSYTVRKKTTVVPKYENLPNQHKDDQIKPDKENTVLKKSIPKFNEKIFKSLEAENWFLNSLKELSAIDGNGKSIRGFQAKVSAIFSVQEVKDKIFVYSLTLRDYINYLNQRFDAKIASDKKLSSGMIHESKVDKLIEKFISE
ncbi:hypothetical protein SAMN04488096_10324 [Mesonia phycicola]|uniref:Uncharacterized protein n=1 Tax=Mesonia phycicola TaxID=579105 RepID=A0A1M6CJQ9_9FLAO|nr:hypothetical protein [Mesonia phycicola]SHI61101.1 hypothetical protein SAMN04488096_10324 [Mesonia phycicola]